MSVHQEKYPKELLDLIITYANKYSEISGEEFQTVILNRTPIYFLIGNNSWEINISSKYWKEFVNRVENGEDSSSVAFDMYQKHYAGSKDVQKWFGCFRYKYIEETQTIKPHFLNTDDSKYGPLAKENFEKRINELKEMFAEIKEKYPEAKYVQGGSWLYNYESYNRLFPKSYTKEMKSINPNTKYLVIWGQFIDSDWSIKKEEAKEFEIKVKSSTTLSELSNSFKYKELFPKGDISEFYKLYNIDIN